MRVLIVGGKLQGVEAAFLAREAGWEAVVVDRVSVPPASGMCEEFHCLDVVNETAALCRLLDKERIDLIIPALEDGVALRTLEKSASATSTPLAYDAAAYSVTHSKKRSNLLFTKLAIPQPRSWPACGFPIIAKPSVASGSQGVVRIDNEEEFGCFRKRTGTGIRDWVLQEYLDGISYSIEVLGVAGKYTALQVTELEMDDGYDCKRVIAPARISGLLERRIRELALEIASGINLTGLMDVELVLDGGVLRVFEIDARLPSQTPVAVYQSTGINMLKMLGEIFVGGMLSSVPEIGNTRSVVYEHVMVSGTRTEVLGEHIMADAGPLEVIPGFFGADVGLSSFGQGDSPFAATLINSGATDEQAWAKRDGVMKNLEHYNERAACPEERCIAPGITAVPLSRG